MTEKDRRCGNCQFHFNGECRRYPPQIGFDPDCDHTGGVFHCFPRVFQHEWCGEFSPIDGWIIPEGEFIDKPGPGAVYEVRN